MRVMRIGLLVYPGCLPAGLFAAGDLFQAINRRLGRPVFEPVWIGTDGAGVTVGGGATLAMSHGLEHPCDAYLLPGFWAETAADIERMLARQSRLVDWLRRLPGHRGLWTYCMGVALAAAAGRLDGRVATATWWLEHALRQRYGAVAWDFQQAIAADGDVVTASGANGYWAVVSHVLLARLPAQVVHDVEQAMLVPRSASAHPVFRSVELFAQPQPQLQRLIAYARQVPASELNLDLAARHLSVSSRTLSRRIGRHTQVSAGQWLRLIKLHQVANALLASPASVKTICADIGFTDAASLMRAFKQATGMTTARYRQQYGRALASFGAG